jgi:hypothetical protein
MNPSDRPNEAARAEGRDAATPAPERRGRFRLVHLVAALVAAPVFGVFTAWLADVAQSDFGFAPWLIFPSLVGVLIGGLIVGEARVAQIGHRPTILAAVVVAWGVAVVGQHYLGYRSYVRRVMSQAEPALLQAFQEAMPGALSERLPSFPEYLRRQARAGRPFWGEQPITGWWVWASWGLDAAVALAAGLAVVLPAAAQPFCSRCRTWYRTIRAGRIDGDALRRLAELAAAGRPPIEGDRPVGGGEIRGAWFRVQNCLGGCGPARLQLSWEEADRRRLADASLAPGQLREALDAIDRQQGGGEPAAEPPEGPPGE